MIKNVSFEQQRDTMDCGVSCLIMPAGYYGKSTVRDRLRLLSDLSKEEVSLLLAKLPKQLASRLVFPTLYHSLFAAIPTPLGLHDGNASGSK